MSDDYAQIRKAFNEFFLEGVVSKEDFLAICHMLDHSVSWLKVWCEVDKENIGNVNTDRLLQYIFYGASDPLPPPAPELLRKISGLSHVGALERQSSRQPKPILEPFVPPKLVRGLTTTTRPSEGQETKDVFAAIRKLVVKALAHKEGWSIVDESAIQIKDCSGFGGSQTYKVEAAGCSPSSVALHSRCLSVVDDPIGEQLTEAAGNELAKLGFAPPRLAYGGDWFIEVWEGTGHPEHDRANLPVAVGKRLAELHATPTAWFEPFREKIRSEKPAVFASAPEASHVWWYANRSSEWFKDEDYPDGEASESMAAYSSACSAFEPLSSASKRIVFTHGDPHRENLLETEFGFKFVDLEFTHVNYAVYDLSYVITCCSWDPGHAMWSDNNAKHREFLLSYLQASNQPHATEDVEALLHDCTLVRHFHHSGPWTPWNMRSKQACEELKIALNKISLLPYADRAKMVSTDEIWKCAPLREYQDNEEQRSLLTLIPRMQKCEWIIRMEKLLHEEKDAVVSCVTIHAQAQEELIIKPLHDPTLALQVKPGSSRLELAAIDGSPNQKWLRDGSGLQHVGSGLYLDTEVKYCHWIGDAPWESNGTELFVRTRDDKSGRQRWTMDKKLGNDEQAENVWLIRHKLGGRAIMVNNLDVVAGRGVNVNMPCIVGRGSQWIIENLNADSELALGELPEPPSSEDRLWAKRDPLGVGLKPREDGYFTIPSAMSFVIKPPLETYNGTSLCLQPKRDYKQGMQLAVDDGDSWNDWKLFDGDRIMHVDTGLFLSSDKTHYIFPKKPECPWEQDCNHSGLGIRSGEGSPDEQRWFFEKEAPGDAQKEGGNVLRHFKDGMVADVACWTHVAGQSVGHIQHFADNQESAGTSWILVCHT